MTRYRGVWRIWQDAPCDGCDDNPSFDWFAAEERDGHNTGRTLRAASREALEKKLGEMS